MKLHRISPILWTKDLNETVSFYETVLGFKATGNFPNFVSLVRNDVEIMFIVPEGETEIRKEGNADFFPKPSLTGSLFILVDEVDEFWKSVKDKATVKTYLADREYLMRDFSILDNNGYELVFGRDISDETVK
jgi:catechol 2,3-dioxygenase-like lactoylglutathione lyase family enzyme